MTAVNHDTQFPPERLFETDAGGWVRAHPCAEAFAKELGAMITRVVGPGAEAVLIPYRMGPMDAIERRIKGGPVSLNDWKRHIDRARVTRTAAGIR